MKNLIAALTIRFNDRISRPSRAAAASVGMIERSQRLAADASSKWNRGLDQLDGKLNRLASASLVTDGLTRAGESMIRPLQRGVTEAAKFNRGMTGIGITAQMTDSQLAPMRRSIMETAREIGAMPAVVQSAFASVLAEGVYKTESELTKAGRSVARFQKLAATMSDPISGDEAGGLSAGLARSFNITADRLDQANAMMNRAAQRGGVSIGVQARFLPAQAAAMRGLGGNTERGLSDLMAATQVSKGSAGGSEQAANNLSNLLAAITSPETQRNFTKMGVNLETEIKAGLQRGISPLETVAVVTDRLTKGGDQFRLGELFGDRQARDGVMALVQNLDEFKDISKDLRGANVLNDYYADLARANEGAAASFDKYTSATARAGIATGTILSPAVGWAADLLGGLANWMAKTSEDGSLLAKAAVWIVAGLAGVAVGAGAVGNAIVGILGPIFIAKTLFGTLGSAGLMKAAAGLLRFSGVIVGPVLGAIRALSIGLLTTPVGWIILGITAVAVAGYLIVRNWSAIKRWWSSFWTGAVAVVGAAWQGVKRWFSQTPLGVLVANWRPIMAFMGGLPARFRGFGRAMIQGLIGGVRSMLSAVGDAVSGVANGAVDRFKSVLGIRSPSRVFAQLGDFMMAGLSMGLGRGTGGAIRQAAAIGSAVVVAISGDDARPPSPPEPPTAPRGPPPGGGAGGYAVGRGGTVIERVDIHVTVQGAANPAATGQAIGNAAAVAIRANLFDGAD